MITKFSKIQSPDKILNRVQDDLSRVLNPVLANPILSYNRLVNVSLVDGTTVIPHGLGRTLVGWELSRVRGPATIYDLQDANSTPDANLILVSSAAVSVDLYLY